MKQTIGYTLTLLFTAMAVITLTGCNDMQPMVKPMVEEVVEKPQKPTTSDPDDNTISDPVTAPEIDPKVDVETIDLSNNSIDENQPIGSIVGTFSVPVGKRLAYTVVAGNRDFSIADGTKLVTNKAFNHVIEVIMLEQGSEI